MRSSEYFTTPLGSCKNEGIPQLREGKVADLAAPGEELFPRPGYLARQHLVENHRRAVQVAARLRRSMSIVIAYIDAPSRKRDLRDLTRILDIYIDDDDERRWSGDVPDDVDFDAASAWLLGQDISYIVGPTERRIINAFCERALEVPLLLELQREAPRVWRVQEAPVARRLAAFQRALTVDRAAT